MIKSFYFQLRTTGIHILHVLAKIADKVNDDQMAHAGLMMSHTSRHLIKSFYFQLRKTGIRILHVLAKPRRVLRQEFDTEGSSKFQFRTGGFGGCDESDGPSRKSRLSTSPVMMEMRHIGAFVAVAMAAFSTRVKSEIASTGASICSEATICSLF